MLPTAATEFYRDQQAISLTVRNEVRRMWRRMGDDFDASWRRTGPQVLATIAEGQAQAALKAQAYTHAVLNELDIPDRPAGELVPDSLVGVASDGRRLDTLASQSVVRAKWAIGSGATVGQALDEGGAWLQLMSALQVADAARIAAGIGSASRAEVGGNIRVLNHPVCQRCAVLGGRFYRWSTGFDRHPGDDCTMMPVRSRGHAQDFLSDPMDAYRAGQIKDLTQAQIKAIEDGANLGQVVNAYRGMGTAGVITREGTSRRGLAGQRLGNFAREPGERYSMSQTPRLTPEAIYGLTGSNRAEAIALLRSNGYIT